ncbi:MAG TPA: isoprenylcysteine carboxylmethyltransferase family protein, partial [Thermoplasmata archaeon]|nr:isoprenylcysteine carboxylmethyltransferase family protein [Thermoplasmata archaeon]
LCLSGVGGVFTGPVLWVGVAISLGGTGVRVWAIHSLGRFFSPVIRIESDHEIVRGGPYRWLRHPSYTGIYLATIGAVVALGSLSGALLTAAIVLATLAHRIRLEERMLLDRFGTEYEQYARSTWRLLPWIY